MARIIHNLSDKIISVTQSQLRTRGYMGTTIRSVAQECGIAVGTVYNYFPSKEALVATHLLEDWKQCILAIQTASACSDIPRPAALCIYEQLISFSRRHQAIFRDETARASFAESFGKYHGILRSQLAEPMRKFCSSDFAAEFLAEALLTWTMAGKSFDEIYGMLERLF